MKKLIVLGLLLLNIMVMGEMSLKIEEDDFNSNDSQYIATLTSDQSAYDRISLQSSKNIKTIEISSSIGRGDGRYSKARSGGMDFKFDDGTKISIEGNSYYLRTTYISIKKDSDLIKKMKTSNWVVVRTRVVGSKKIKKYDLKGSLKTLNSKGFEK